MALPRNNNSMWVLEVILMVLRNRPGATVVRQSTLLGALVVTLVLFMVVCSGSSIRSISTAVNKHRRCSIRVRRWHRCGTQVSDRSGIASLAKWVTRRRTDATRKVSCFPCNICLAVRIQPSHRIYRQQLLFSDPVGSHIRFGDSGSSMHAGARSNAERSRRTSHP